jgi:hypothetical protein
MFLPHLLIRRIAVVTLLLGAGLAMQGKPARGESSGQRSDSTADHTQILTGVIGDAICGRKHAMRGKSDVDCTRECVQRGSKYTLMLGGKVYILEGGSANTLDELAGARVLVSGTVQGDTLRVKSITVASSQQNQSKP